MFYVIVQTNLTSKSQTLKNLEITCFVLITLFYYFAIKGQ